MCLGVPIFIFSFYEDRPMGRHFEGQILLAMWYCIFKEFFFQQFPDRIPEAVPARGNENEII